jgi:hypothetical protein
VQHYATVTVKHTSLYRTKFETFTKYDYYYYYYYYYYYFENQIKECGRERLAE